MATATSINWCHHTFNPWSGCAHAEPNYGGCDNCYAERWAHRNPKVFGDWGPDGVRVVRGRSYWNLPFKWDRAAKSAAERRRVFCGSMMDFAERRSELVEPRERLWNLIRKCTWLDFLLLTKRIEEVPRFWHEAWGGVAPDNVWLGATIENQEAAWARVPVLLRISAAVRFLSIEPMLEKIVLPAGWLTGLLDDWFRPRPSTHWVIVGGESGPGCRPCNPDWIRSVVAQCRAAGVAVWVKQLGGHPNKRARLEDLPKDLRIRELPR